MHIWNVNVEYVQKVFLLYKYMIFMKWHVIKHTLFLGLEKNLVIKLYSHLLMFHILMLSTVFFFFLFEKGTL